MSLDDGTKFSSHLLVLENLLSDIRINKIVLMHDKLNKLAELLIAWESAIIPGEVQQIIWDSVLKQDKEREGVSLGSGGGVQVCSRVSMTKSLPPS